MATKPEEFRVWIPATSPVLTDKIIGELVSAVASQVAKGELRSIQSWTLKHWVSSTDPLFTDGNEAPDGYNCAFTFTMMAVRGAKSEVPS
jgi:hypothetical protein